MSFSRRLLKLLCILIALTQFSCGGGCTEKKHREALGKQAPDFTLPLLGQPDKSASLSEIVKNRGVLLVFWATWCPSCVHEIPILNGWMRDYKDRGLVIYGINVGETPSKITRFSKNISIDYPVLLDTSKDVSASYGVSALPVAVLLAKGGKIIYYGFSLPHIEKYFDPPEDMPSYKELTGDFG